MIINFLGHVLRVGYWRCNETDEFDIETVAMVLGKKERNIPICKLDIKTMGCITCAAWKQYKADEKDAELERRLSMLT